MISFKQEFIKTLHLLKQSKVTMKRSYDNPELLAEGIMPEQASETLFFPLAGRCVAREESFGYILVAHDVVFIVDKLAISVLKMCNGFNSVKEIKEGVKEKLGCSKSYSGLTIEAAVEQTLSNLGKNGLTLWIPRSQAHLERHRGG